ncbi:MAG: FKBP-type peptidyl-prolyl cis-trans isomerase [Bacteroidetes bacterium]|nr:FKBP-type peptidyl-prolyl cis-trans isomerase [Bacteroidota bacterium]
MKNVSIISLMLFSLLSCSEGKKNVENRNITLNDTVTTSSGLKYIFLKEGKGRKIEVGSKVKSYIDLYINDADTIFWTTSTDKDSIFQFIHGKTSLIKGFSELNNYLVEGDKVIAILPDSLAYGKEGRNGVPPGASLIYNPYIVKFVSMPKKVLTDTLFYLASTMDEKASIDFYEQVMASELKVDYHTELGDIIDLLAKLNKDSLYIETLSLSDYFIDKTGDDALLQSVKYYKLVALDAQGKYQEAIALVEPLTKQVSNQEYWKTTLKELQEKLNDNQ